MNLATRTIVALAGLSLSLASCSKGPGPAAGGQGASPPSTAPEKPSASPENAPSGPDTLQTSKGPLTVTPVYHATAIFGFGGKQIVLDPWSKGDLSHAPKADYVFLTDIHPDHLDQAGIDAVKRPDTVYVAPPSVAEKLSEKPPQVVVLKNGDKHDFGLFSVEAVPMYNLKRGPSEGKLFHDKGRGDGFVFTFGDKRVYVSGDTECTPEMKALSNIDVAFVCMNLPYTMPPSEAAECVKAFKPKILYPYHFRDSNLGELTSALGDGSGVEVRVRKWY